MKKPIITREYWESSGNIYRVKVFISDDADMLYTVQMHDTATNDLEGKIVLRHFDDGKWIEPENGETQMAKEYGTFIDNYAKLYSYNS